LTRSPRISNFTPEGSTCQRAVSDASMGISE
jgi:hypothetical protein